MYYLPTFCLICLFLFSLFPPLLSTSSRCETLFQCGNITAGFPLWGGSRSKYCGHPLLELHCYNNITSSFISDHVYHVLDINQTSYTLKLVSPDLLQEPFCSSILANETLPPDLFNLSENYKSVTFYRSQPVSPHRSSYKCPEIGKIFVSESPIYDETCLSSFTVKVPMSFLIKEKELDLQLLESALRKGFEVKVKINEKVCQECSSSHGICSYDETLPSGVKCKPPIGGKKSTKNTGFIAAAVSISALALIVACVFLLIRPRRKTQEAQYTSKDHDVKKQNLMDLIPLKHYSYAQVQRITKSFAEVVGKGGFGTVYRGTLSDGRSVAVKILKDSKGNGEDFINEVSSMSKTSHVNIVTLLGFCSESSKRAIIYEFLENGSLDKFISSKRSSNMDWKELYMIALGIARGLEYLHHGCRTRIVHFDIKPQNVLLDDNLSPKVSDFGLAKLCERTESIMSLLEARGTIGYIAPEVFSSVYGRVSHKSDVYSYGMLVLEIIGARNRTPMKTLHLA